MKKTEIALIILIAAISFGLSWWLGNLILKDPSEKVETIKYMSQIGSDLVLPHEDNFNPYTTNPTVEVYIGFCREGIEEWDDVTKTCKNILENNEEDE